MSLRPRATPPVVSPVASRLDFVLRVGTNERSVEDVGVLERKGGPRSDFDKFTDTNEARLYRQRVARARAANAAKHKAAMEAAAAADAQAKEVLGSDEPQWLQDAAAAVKAAPARPTRAEAGVQTAPEQEARERIERNETELLTSVGLQVNLRDDGAAILREVKEQIKADGAQLEKMHGTIDSLRLQRDRMVAVLEDLVAQGVKDREKIALVEATIASTQTTIDTLAKNFDRFMEESAAIIKDSIRDLLENRLQALENNCINEVAKQTNEIRKLREQISRMADKDVVGDIMERVAERRAHEADEMRKVLSMINPDKFAEELFYAVQKNNLEKIKLLIEYGADPYRLVLASPHSYLRQTASALEGAFYGNLASTSMDVYNKQKYKLQDSLLAGRIEIFNYFGAKKKTLHGQYNTSVGTGSFESKVEFGLEERELIPSKLLGAALNAGVLTNEPLLYNTLTFTLGATTRQGTTPLYLAGRALLRKRIQFKTPYGPNPGGLMEKEYVLVVQNYKASNARVNAEATARFTEMLQVGFRDDGFRALLDFLANGDVPWTMKDGQWIWTYKFDGKHSNRPETVGKLTDVHVRREFSAESAKEILALVDKYP